MKNEKEKEVLMGLSVEELVKVILDLQEDIDYLVSQNNALEDELWCANGSAENEMVSLQDEIESLNNDIEMLQDEILTLQDERGIADEYTTT